MRPFIFTILILIFFPISDLFAASNTSIVSLGIGSLPDRKGEFIPIFNKYNLELKSKTQLEIGYEFFFNSWLGISARGYHSRGQDAIVTYSGPFIITGWEAEFTRSMLSLGPSLWWRFAKNWGINYQYAWIIGKGEYSMKNPLDTFGPKIEKDYSVSGNTWEISLSYHFSQQGVRAGLRSTTEKYSKLDDLYLKSDNFTYRTLILGYFLAI